MTDKKKFIKGTISFFLIILLTTINLKQLKAKTEKYNLNDNFSEIGFIVKHKITKDVYGEFLKTNGIV